jgi:hypothetical protein
MENYLKSPYQKAFILTGSSDLKSANLTLEADIGCIMNSMETSQKIPHRVNPGLWHFKLYRVNDLKQPLT